MPVLAWFGIGCGGLVLIAIVIISLFLVGFCQRKASVIAEFRQNPEKAVAEMVVRHTPGLKLISQNEASGEMTIQNKNGKKMTLKYKDILDGKFSVKDSNGNDTEIGESDLSNLPTWLPRVPSLKVTNVTAQNSQDEGGTGGYIGTSTDSLDTLEAFIKKAASKLNLNSSNSTSINSDGNDMRIIAYEAGSRKLNVILSSKSAGETLVQVSYEEKK